MKVQFYSIFLKKTQVLAQMKQYRRKLDSWDVLVKETINSFQFSSFLREMDQCFLQSNHLAHTTVAKSETSSTQDFQNKNSASSKKVKYKLSYSLHLYFSRSENGKISSKKI